MAHPPAPCIYPPELLLAAQDVRTVLLDVDGVLTDGGLYFSEQGESLKRFNTQDGYGLGLLRHVGITPVVITGRDSPALRMRLQALGIEQAHYGISDKRLAAQKVLATLQLDWSQVAAMGDDWPDLGMLLHCALPCAPANAHLEIRAVARFVSKARGGEGAVRELCDLLLCAQNQYAPLFAKAQQ